MHILFGLGFWFDCITRFKLFFSLHSSRGMGLDDSELVDDSDGGGKASLVHCSICLEIVAENRDRSWAKLQCGHQFHLDCIGSAFNIKGAMQCPNCRKIEKGQWLYANGSRPFPEFSVDDLAHEEDLYDLGYSEMSFGVHWCPFSGLTRLPSSFEDAEFSTSGYHDILGQAILAEQASVSSTTHPCPYVAYFGPIHPSSSSIGGNAADNLNFGSNWNSGNGTSVAREVSAPSYGFPSMDLHYRHSSPFSSTSHIGNAEAQRPVRTGSDIPRSGSFLHPFVVGHSPGGRTGSSAASSMVPPPPYPGSNARARDRVQALQAYYQQQQPNSPPSMRAPVMSGNRRFGHRGLAPPGALASPTDQSGGFYVFPSGASTRNLENNASSRFQGWERESSAGQIERDSGRGFYQGLDSGSIRSGNNYRQQRHGAERAHRS